MIALTVALLGCSSSGGGSGSSANDSTPPTAPQQPNDDSNSSENEGGSGSEPETGGESEPEKDDSFAAILNSLTTEQKAEMVGKTQVPDPLQNQNPDDKELYLELSKAFFGPNFAEKPMEMFGFEPGNVGPYDNNNALGQAKPMSLMMTDSENFVSSEIDVSHFNSSLQIGQNNPESSYGLLVYEAFATNESGAHLDYTNAAVVFAAYAGNPTLYSKSIDFLKGTAEYKGTAFIGEHGGLRADTQPERVLTGDFTLTADFDNKAVHGTIVDHIGNDGWGTTTLENTAINIVNDQMTFKGDASLDNNFDNLKGTYEGQFMGPAASEVVGTASLDGTSVDGDIRVEAAFGGSRQ